VALQGVNADVDTLEALSYRLYDIGVLPYYLHTFDPVAGALHFDAGTESVVTIYQALQGRLPGYLLPKLVTEYPGQQAKTLVPITPLN
jgi:L-lysine 2,3-aminomutase